MRALAAVLALATALAEPQALDRSQIPSPGPAPVFHVPGWTTSTMAIGADLMVSEAHTLPLVDFRITFMGGSHQFESRTRRGVASLTAAMLSEGTKTRDGQALSNALQLLGTNVSASVQGESGAIGFLATTTNFPQALNILVDMLVNPRFPPESLDRLRAQRLVALAQAKVEPDSVAARVFPVLLYGASHPFGQPTTEETVKAITRDDVVAFYKSYFRPGRALVTVVGDVDKSGVKTMIERALVPWPHGGDRPSFTYPRVPERAATTIYLVDKPGAAQSTFRLGNPGPPRSTPDYYALEVMNMMLGGLFQSRLNANIREEKGYSYGVHSSFDFGRGPGAFSTGADIVSAKSDVALVEFMKELRGIVGTRPVTDEELKMAKDSLIQWLPNDFELLSGIQYSIAALWTEGLPNDYYQQYAIRIGAVTKADVVRVAKQYIDLDRLAIVIVGDRASIEGPLKATGIAPITPVAIDGTIAAR